ncbi:hypothetical protein Tco_0538650 [Tanacetum coccineum]
MKEDWYAIRAKLEANAELSNDVFGKWILPGTRFCKGMVDMKVEFEEIKEESLHMLVQMIVTYRPINLESYKGKIEKIWRRASDKNFKEENQRFDNYMSNLVDDVLLRKCLYIRDCGRLRNMYLSFHHEFISMEHEHEVLNLDSTGMRLQRSQSVRSSNAIALDLLYLLVLITGASQSRQHVDISLIHIESRKPPIKSLFDVDSSRISIVIVNTKEHHSDFLAVSQG